MDGHVLDVVVVADGVGGEKSGAWASKTAVESILQTVQAAADSTSIPQLMHTALIQANQTLLQQRKLLSNRDGAATTAVLAAIEQEQLFICHLGDSRAYLVRNGIAKQLTLDHTVVQEELDQGQITAAAIERHPERHTITRFLGDDAVTRPDPRILDPTQKRPHRLPVYHRNMLYSLKLEPDDRILLCTDGLSDVVPPEEIARITLAARSVSEAVDTLVRQAIQNGTPDNVTAVVIARNSNVGAPRAIRKIHGGLITAFMLAIAVSFIMLLTYRLNPGPEPLAGTIPTLEIAKKTATTVVALTPTVDQSPSPEMIFTPATVAEVLPTSAPTLTPTPTETPAPTSTPTESRVLVFISDTSSITYSVPVAGLENVQAELGDTLIHTDTNIATHTKIVPDSKCTSTAKVLRVTLRAPNDQVTIEEGVKFDFNWSQLDQLPTGCYYNVVLYAGIEAPTPDNSSCWAPKSLIDDALAITSPTSDNILADQNLLNIIEQLRSHASDSESLERIRRSTGEFLWTVALYEGGNEKPTCILSELRSISLRAN